MWAHTNGEKEHRKLEEEKNPIKKNKHPISISRAHFCAISIAWALSKADQSWAELSRAAERAIAFHSSCAYKIFASTFGAVETNAPNIHSEHHSMITPLLVAHNSFDICLLLFCYCFITFLFIWRQFFLFISQNYSKFIWKRKRSNFTSRQLNWVLYASFVFGQRIVEFSSSLWGV